MSTVFGSGRYKSLRLTFEALVPKKGDDEQNAQGVKEWIAMILEEHGCRDIRCIEVRENIEQMRINK